MTKIAGALGPVLVALLGLAANAASSRNRRARLKQDAEIWKLLPEQSDSRQLLEDHMRRTVLRLAEDDEKRRDPIGIVLGLVFLGLSGWTGVLALDGSNWWLAAATPLGVLGLVGLATDATRATRDERGRRIQASRGENKPGGGL